MVKLRRIRLVGSSEPSWSASAAQVTSPPISVEDSDRVDTISLRASFKSTAPCLLQPLHSLPTVGALPAQLACADRLPATANAWAHSFGTTRGPCCDGFQCGYFALHKRAVPMPPIPCNPRQCIPLFSDEFGCQCAIGLVALGPTEASPTSCGLTGGKRTEATATVSASCLPSMPGTQAPIPGRPRPPGRHHPGLTARFTACTRTVLRGLPFSSPAELNAACLAGPDTIRNSHSLSPQVVVRAGWCW